MSGERPLSEAELDALPMLARGAALRFLLTRTYDLINTDANALVRTKDPNEYLRKLRFHQRVKSYRDYGLGRLEDGARPKVVIHTDGACSGNPGPGGWGAILESGAHRKELKGGEALTTNNRMELTAAIKALEALKAPSEVELYTDSNYLRGGITEWITEWKTNGWRTADRKPVRNAELWQRLEETARRMTSRWHWVQGPCRP